MNTNRLLTILAITNVIDLMLTVIFWDAEVNPLVLKIGLFNFIALKFVTTIIFVIEIEKNQGKEKVITTP